MKKKIVFALTGACVALGLSAVALVGCSGNEDSLYSEWVTTVAATCEKAGTQTRALLSDPNVIQKRAVPATGHDWNEWQELTAPTCLVAGVGVRTCKTCENSDYQPIAALGHEWGEWQTTSAPVCTVAGYETRTCLHDENHTDLRAIPALGHDWGEWVVTVAPTCTEEGIETRFCRNCNDHTETRALSSYGHDWSEWVVSRAPDEEYDGEELRVCRNEKTHTETKTIPAVGTEMFLFHLNKEGTEYRINVHPAYRTTLSGTLHIPAMHNGLPVTEIGPRGFASCREIEQVDLRETNIKEIGAHAFMRCRSLRNAMLPEGVTVLKNSVFYGCEGLESLSLPASLTEIERDRASSNGVFDGARDLKTITVAEGNSVYRVENNCLIERATDTVILGSCNAVLPEGVQIIGERAFSYLNIECVRIPASVTKISDEAFYMCEMLASVTFAEDSSLTEIGENAFGWTAIEEIEIPQNVVTLNGFYGCKALKRVVILSDAVQTIGYHAFSSCEAIEELHLPASVKEIDPWAFSVQTLQILTISEENPYFYTDNGCIIEKGTNKLIICADGKNVSEKATAIGDRAFAAWRWSIMSGSVMYIGANITSVDAKAFRVNVFPTTIYLLGFASAEEADEAWGTAWREHCESATIIYAKNMNLSRG